MTDRRSPINDNQGHAGTVSVAPVELSTLEGGTPQPPSQESQDMNLKMILDIPVDIHVELGHTQISIRDILKLGSGAIIELDRLAGSPADIIVNGKLIGQGDVVVINENFGIRITKLVTPEERIDLL